jgi:UTP--glucose-1-phosphate uridylyltransferase
MGDEPFIYTFADDLTVAEPNGYKQMIERYQEFNASILPCIRIDRDEEFKSYGVLGGTQIRDDVLKMDRVIEKPGRENAPSNFASVGGYLLTPDVFDYLEAGKAALQPGQEFYLTDAVIEPMLRDGKSFYGCEVTNGTRYDTGDKLGYLKTVVDFALKRNDIGPAFREFLKDLEL